MLFLRILWVKTAMHLMVSLANKSNSDHGQFTLSCDRDIESLSQMWLLWGGMEALWQAHRLWLMSFNLQSYPLLAESPGQVPPIHFA